MRPPEFTGGNRSCRPIASTSRPAGFNEAAGIHRRKPRLPWLLCGPGWLGFNEAAGIHRRKLLQKKKVYYI